MNRDVSGVEASDTIGCIKAVDHDKPFLNPLFKAKIQDCPYNLDHVKAKTQTEPPLTLDPVALDAVDTQAGIADNGMGQAVANRVVNQFVLTQTLDLPLGTSCTLDHVKARIQAEPPLTLDSLACNTVDSSTAPVLWVCAGCEAEHFEVVERCRRCWLPRPGSGAPRLPDFPDFDDQNQRPPAQQRAAEAGSVDAGPSPATSGPLRKLPPRTTRARRATAAGRGR